jgi:hypothetical protein
LELTERSPPKHEGFRRDLLLSEAIQSNFPPAEVEHDHCPLQNRCVIMLSFADRRQAGERRQP